MAATTKKHLVTDGDTLESLASKYSTTPQDIAALNSIQDNTLYTGSSLDIPELASAADAAVVSQPAQTSDTSAPSPYSSGKWYSGSDTSSGSSSGILQSIEGGIPSYEQSDAVRAALEALQKYEASKPGEYTSQYEDQINTVLDKILNRPDFSYDATTDPLYQYYRDAYQQQGERAMEDTVAEAASLTGGYGNSYAMTAGSQQYQNYLSQLNQVIPTLYQQSRDEYNTEGSEMRSDLSMLQGLDESDYSRYQGDLESYYNDLSYYYTKYSDMSQQEYEAYLTDLSRWQSDRDYWYSKYSDELARAAAAASGGGGGGGGRSYSSNSSSGSSRYNAFMSAINSAAKQGASSALNVSANKSIALRYYNSGELTKSEYNKIVNALNNLKAAQYKYVGSGNTGF